LALAAALCVHVAAQSSAGDSQEDLQKYAPVLPSVKAQFWKIDPKLDMRSKASEEAVYVISDNMWQSAFLVTDEGVIVFDAPASFGQSIPSAISQVTDQPIKVLVYSHVHKDHIGGSAAFKSVKDLKIVALDTVSDFLKRNERSGSIVTQRNFQTAKKLTLGGKTVELSRRDYHSNEAISSSMSSSQILDGH